MFVYRRRMPDHDRAQRQILQLLLEAHPRLIGVDEVVRRLEDVPRVEEALRVLVADGLATTLGDRVGVSRAAVRGEVLLKNA
jgi:hypothetical protein